MTVKLLIAHHLDFLSLKGFCKGLSECLSLHLLKCHIVGYFMLQLIFEYEGGEVINVCVSMGTCPSELSC